MKAIFHILISITIMSPSLYSQVIYENNYNDGGAFAGYDIKPTSDNGFIITGFSNPTNTLFGQDILLIKIDSIGEVEWFSSFGDIGSDAGYGVIQTYDGGFAIIGNISNPSTSSNDIYLIRTNSSGTFLWQKIWGDTLGDYGFDIVEVPIDSGFAISGKYDGHSHLLRTDKFGDTLWTKSYPDTAAFYSINLTSDGGLIMSGEHYGYISGNLATRGYVAKTDLLGNDIWLSYFDGGGSERLYDCMEISSGNFAVVGESIEDSPPPFADAIIRVLDNTGNLIWYNTFGTSESNNFKSLCFSTDFGFVMAGNTWVTSGSNDNNQVYLVRTDANGNLVWEYDFGDDILGNEYGWSVSQSNDGGYIISGQKIIGGQISLYVIKVNEFGSTVSTIELPKWNDFNLYPNPMNDKTTLEFLKPIPGGGTLSIYTVSGQLVLIEQLPINCSSYILERNQLNSGTYILSIENGKSIISKKLIIN